MRTNNWKGYQHHFKRPKKGCRYRNKKAVNLKPLSVPIGAATVLPTAGRGARCLSLFDGIASGLVALDELGIQVDAYFSSEIDEAALEVQRFHFHDRLIMLGNVTEITGPMLQCLGPIDLLIGGSPCSQLSLVNYRAKGFEDPDSSANLFFEFSRIRDWLQDAAAKQNRTFHYLFENTRAMKICHRNIISDRLGVQPISRNAKDHTGMQRDRFFWSNIPQPEIFEKSNAPTKLQDHLKPYRKANFDILPTITTNSSSQRHGSKRTLPVSLTDGKQSLLLLPEQESLFGHSPHFTDVGNLSLTTRRKLLGKSWCIPVIVELLRPLLVHFEKK